MAHPISVWKRSDTRLWRVDLDEPKYLYGVFLEDIERNYEELYTRILLSGYLPENEWLFHLTGKEILEVVHGLCYDPSVYRPEDVVMRINACSPRHAWIEYPVICCVELDDPLTICAEIDCYIETFFNKESSE